jgi:hypothetical protein
LITGQSGPNKEETERQDLSLPNDNVRVFVTTHYESLEVESVDSVDFTVAVEQGIRNLRKYTIASGDRTQDYFAVYLGFSPIDEGITAVSAMLGFHEASTDADYFLQQWTSHFTTHGYREIANLAVSAIDRHIQERLKEGWWES